MAKNKNNCKIILNNNDNKEQELVEYINLNENMKKKDKLEIKKCLIMKVADKIKPGE